MNLTHNERLKSGTYFLSYLSTIKYIETDYNATNGIIIGTIQNDFLGIKPGMKVCISVDHKDFSVYHITYTSEQNAERLENMEQDGWYDFDEEEGVYVMSFQFNIMTGIKIIDAVEDI